MSRTSKIETILKTMPTIAVVGLSSHPHKAGYYVPAYMQRHGYRILPVNPNLREALGEQAYDSLLDLPCAVDIVQIFRQPQYVDEAAEQAVAIGARALWLQRGIHSARARELAEAAQILYVEDRCMMVEHRHLLQYGWRGLAAAQSG